MALPKKVGDAADRLYELREKRLELQRAQETELKKLKDKEEEMEQHVIALMSAQGLESARGDVATVTRTKKTVLKVVDMMKLWAWAKKNDDPSIFHKRVATEHYVEVAKGGKVVPGVEALVIPDLSITRAAKKA